MGYSIGERNGDREADTRMRDVDDGSNGHDDGRRVRLSASIFST